MGSDASSAPSSASLQWGDKNNTQLLGKLGGFGIPTDRACQAGSPS